MKINTNTFATLDEAKAAAIRDVLSAARRARGRHLTQGKADIYQSKRAELKAWIDAGRPETAAGIYPWADVDVESGIYGPDVLTPAAALAARESIISNLEPIGLVIEESEQQAKVEIKGSTDYSEVEVNRGFYVMVLGKI